MSDMKEYINDGMIEKELQVKRERQVKSMKMVLMTCILVTFITILTGILCLFIDPELKLAGIFLLVWSLTMQPVGIVLLKRIDNNRAKMLENKEYFVAKDKVVKKIEKRYNLNRKSNEDKYLYGIKLERCGEIIMQERGLEKYAVADEVYVVCYDKYPKVPVLYYRADEFEYIGSKEKAY